MKRTGPRNALLVVVAAVALTTTSQARATACSGIQASAKDLVVTTTPATPCLVVTVEPVGCGDSLGVLVRNTCAAAITLPADFYCGEIPAVCVSAPPNEIARVTPKVAADGTVDATYTITVDGKPVALRVGFVEVETAPSEGGSDQSSGGCSVVATRTSAWNAGAALAGLTVLAAAYARRRRARALGAKR